LVFESITLPDAEESTRFEQTVLPHLDDAYNLARWLTRREHDADDVLQESLLRAYRFFGGFHGGDARVWLLAIVRNSSYSWLDRHKDRQGTEPFDEQIHTANVGPSPESQTIAQEDQALVRRSIETLSPEFREVIVLRELEGMSYKQIAAIAQVPLGTVMSRLARARDLLQESLGTYSSKEAADDMR
jgi:RNA polymerase sigma factor (sigma-70 family)